MSSLPGVCADAEALSLIARTVGQDDTGSRLLWVFARANGEHVTPGTPRGDVFEPGAMYCADVCKTDFIFAAALRACAELFGMRHVET